MNTPLKQRITRTLVSLAGAAFVTFTSLHLIVDYALPQHRAGVDTLLAAAAITPVR